MLTLNLMKLIKIKFNEIRIFCQGTDFNQLWTWLLNVSKAKSVSFMHSICKPLYFYCATFVRLIHRCSELCALPCGHCYPVCSTLALCSVFVCSFYCLLQELPLIVQRSFLSHGISDLTNHLYKYCSQHYCLSFMLLFFFNLIKQVTRLVNFNVFS